MNMKIGIRIAVSVAIIACSMPSCAKMSNVERMTDPCPSSIELPLASNAIALDVFDSSRVSKAGIHELKGVTFTSGHPRELALLLPVQTASEKDKHTSTYQFGDSPYEIWALCTLRNGSSQVRVARNLGRPANCNVVLRNQAQFAVVCGYSSRN